MKPLSAPYCVNIVHTRKLILSFLKIFGSCLLYVGTQYAYPLFVRILTSCKMYVIHTSYVGTRNCVTGGRPPPPPPPRFCTHFDLLRPHTSLHTTYS